MNIIPFSQCNIYEFKLDREAANLAYQDFKKSKLFWKKIAPENNTSVGYLDSDYKIPWYNESLCDWFDKCLKQVSEKHFYNRKLEMIDLWLNSANSGSFSHKHSHSCSIVSGLYYLTDHEHSETVFEYYDPWLKGIDWLYDASIVTNPSIKIKPESGKLIIWKSDFIHSVNIHRETKPRNTIAFNTFFDGWVSNAPTGIFEINCVSVKKRHQTYLDSLKPNTIEK